ncbi:tRNA (cytidine/uridine-2'-O-)-methyltransferase [Desulfatibacillum alkenivorans DSM 16219]|uniref:Putative tRNA (cytidine(34)-2'-O)-methyltransferase n=2 Tax=Desulfatibacillum alkenivorans TaxID=259354 RepID=A0A1M6F352_9BACT|nr:tRNA (cytidine/uridine-2'-O-)-methyltransferase [Desulfatibacillum alkenivorans DSM 16219]
MNPREKKAIPIRDKGLGNDYTILTWGRRPLWVWVMERHIVLVEPEIHWNTGNIGRTCLGAGADLHLIKPLGFSLDSSHVKRAGLDYWERVRLHTWESFDEFSAKMRNGPDETLLFSKFGARPFWDMPSHMNRLFLVLGAETRGLPQGVLDQYPGNVYHVPITNEIRSLNLSTTAGIVLYESMRGLPPGHAWK